MLILFVVAFLDIVGFGIIMPMIPVLSYNYELTTLQIGVLVSSFFFAQFFGSIIIGYLSDIWGRKQILTICLMGLVICYFLTGFIQTITHSFYYLVAIRALVGFFSGNIAIVFATASNFSSKKDLVKNMSYLGSAFTLGFIFGPTIGGYLSRDYDSITPFYFTSIFYTLCLVLVVFFFKNPVIKDDSPRENILISLTKVFRNPSMFFPLSLFIFFSFSFAGLEVFLLTQTLGLAMGFSPFIIGLIWTYFAIVLTVVQIFITKYIPKKVAITGGLIIFGTSILMLSFTNNIYSLCLILLAIAFGLGILFPNINADLSLKGSEKQKGLIFGVNFSAEAIGGFLGPYLLSFIFSITGVIYSAWIILGTLSLILSIISIFYLSKQAKTT